MTATLAEPVVAAPIHRRRILRLVVIGTTAMVTPLALGSALALLFGGSLLLPGLWWTVAVFVGLFYLAKGFARAAGEHQGFIGLMTGLGIMIGSLTSNDSIAASLITMAVAGAGGALAAPKGYVRPDPRGAAALLAVAVAFGIPCFLLSMVSPAKAAIRAAGGASAFMVFTPHDRVERHVAAGSPHEMRYVVLSTRSGDERALSVVTVRPQGVKSWAAVATQRVPDACRPPGAVSLPRAGSLTVAIDEVSRVCLLERDALIVGTAPPGTAQITIESETSAGRDIPIGPSLMYATSAAAFSGERYAAEPAEKPLRIVFRDRLGRLLDARVVPDAGGNTHSFRAGQATGWPGGEGYFESIRGSVEVWMARSDEIAAGCGFRPAGTWIPYARMRPDHGRPVDLILGWEERDLEGLTAGRLRARGRLRDASSRPCFLAP